MASPPTDGRPFEGSDFEPSPKGLEYYMGPHAYRAMRGLGDMAAWALENVVPGTSDAASLRDSIQSSRGIGPALAGGRWGDAGLRTGETMANALGVLPGLPALGGIIAGRKALSGVDPASFARAEEMLGNSLADPAGRIPASVREQIFKETGAYRGPEGAWRKEIVDDPAKVRLREPPEGYPGPIGISRLLEHPELYAAYPQLKHAEVKSIPGRGGAWEERANTMHLGSDLDPKSRLSVMLHEIQHGVQGYENFSRGGNPATMARVPGGMRHVDMSSNEIPTFEQFKRILSGAAKRGAGDDAAIRLKYEEYVDQMRRAGHGGRDLKAEPYTRGELLEGYFRLYGEAEARLAETDFATRLSGKLPMGAPYNRFDRPEHLLTAWGGGSGSHSSASLARSLPKAPQRKDWEKIALDRLLRDIRDPRGLDHIALNSPAKPSLTRPSP